MLGAALIILFATRETPAGAVMGSRGLVGIGLVSYSAYLWHQPVFAFARLRSLVEPTGLMMSALSLLAFALAYLSWKYVEQPLRRSDFCGRRRFLSGVIAITACVAAFGVAGHYQNGFEGRLSREELGILSAKDDISGKFKTLGRKGVQPEWILLGDSHADRMQEAFGAVLSSAGKSALVETIEGCPPARNLVRVGKEHRTRCHEHYSDVIRIIEERNIRYALVSARFALYINSERYDNEDGGAEPEKTRDMIFDVRGQGGKLREKPLRQAAIINEISGFMKALSESGVAVHVMTSIPEVGWDVPRKARSLIGAGTEVRTRRIVHEKRNRPVSPLMTKLSAIANLKILDSSRAFCDTEFCYATKNLVPLYTDSNHLSRVGAEVLINALSGDLMKNHRPQDE